MRRPRVYVPGYSQHVFQRGINCGTIFHEDRDQEHFLLLVQNAAQSHDVGIHAYALMDTHYHLLATPSSQRGLPDAMKEIDSGYVRYYNRKHQRLGTLWCARYKAKLIADENYWLTCMRYIELNPVSAGMVDDAAAYRWSSYRAHALEHPTAWLTSHPVYEQLGATSIERQRIYRAFCAQGCQTPSDTPL